MTDDKRFKIEACKRVTMVKSAETSVNFRSSLHSALLLVCALSSQASMPVLAEPTAPVPIRHFEQVTSILWRGAQPDEDGLKWLAEHDVRTVIDLRAICTRHEQHLAEGLGLRYIRIPLGYGAPGDNEVDSFLALAQSAKQPIFVHCKEGQDRTGTLIGIYRMVVQDWPFRTVYAEMRKMGFKPWFWGLRSTVRYARKKFGVSSSLNSNLTITSHAKPMHTAAASI